MKPLPTSALKSHQCRSAEHLLSVLQTCGAALDGSDTGTGKTYVAAAVVAALDLPTLVLCPKISCTDWRRALAHCGTSATVAGWEKIRTGTTGYGWWQNPRPKKRLKFWKCLCCLRTIPEPELATPCRNGPGGIHCIEPAKAPAWNLGRFHWHPAVKFLIFDEVHRANGRDSQNAEMLIAAKRQGIKTLGLSATPAVSPLQFRALGYLLDLHQLTGPNGFYPWSARHGCRKHPAFGHWDWLARKDEKNPIMERIAQEVFPARGVRVRCQDIPGFPRRVVEASLFDLEGSGRADELYSIMADAIAELHGVKKSDVNPENPLTRVLRCRQELELLKVPIVVELARDYLEKGVHPVLFCNYTQTIDEIVKMAGWEDVIDGRNTDRPEERQRIIDRFAEDSLPVLLVNSKAGGVSVSLQDMRGEFPRVGLTMPDSSVITMRQVFGRLPRLGGKSVGYYRIILLAGTKEVEIYDKFQAKSGNLDALLDSDLVPNDCV